MKIDSFMTDRMAMKELGDRVKAARISVPLTQEELAARSGLSTRTIQRLEAGLDIKQSGMLAVLRVLGCFDNLDLLVTEPFPRPQDHYGNMRPKKRATPVRFRKKNSLWVWGEDK